MSGFDDLNYTVAAVTTTYTVSANDYLVTADSTGGSFTITLPSATAASNKGRQLIFVKSTNAANTVTLAPSAGNIDGGANVTLAASAFHGRIVMCDGANWFTVAQL